jgi:lipopolysaccharide export system protein LptC
MSTALRRWRRVFDRLSIYLPILLMALLALGTYWMLKNTPAPLVPTPEKPLMHEVDYYMHKFAVKTFDGSGKLKSEVAGIELRHFPDSDTVEIDKVRIRSFDVQGRLTTATADRALSNADGSEVQLFGNAQVVREAVTDANGQALPRLEFRGDFLHAFLNDERIKSHLPVTLTRGQDRFSGDSLFYDNLARAAQLQGHVKGMLMPRK